MNFILTTHNVTLTKAIEEHILARLQKLEHFDNHFINARVSLEHDHRRMPEKSFKCSMQLTMRGPDLYAEDAESDLYAAIDLVTKKLEQQIRKRHSKRKAGKHAVAARLKSHRQNSQT